MHQRIANVRADFLHKTSTAISKNHAIVVLEDLRIRNMSASASGTREQPGTNVNRKTQAQFLCVLCGHSENADLVAAKNILAAGHAVSACGEMVQSDRSVKQEPTERPRHAA